MAELFRSRETFFISRVLSVEDVFILDRNNKEVRPGDTVAYYVMSLRGTVFDIIEGCTVLSISSSTLVTISHPSFTRKSKTVSVKHILKT